MLSVPPSSQVVSLDQWRAWDRFRRAIERSLADPSLKNLAERVLARQAFIKACGE